MSPDTAHASLTLHDAFVVGELDPRLFGGFLEHMGRAIYTGIYEPGHPEADENGFRRDVSELVRELGPTIVRYPGGNFVSAFNWEDSVGPAGQRPVRRDLAWRSRETNAFGLNEFATWCQELGTEMMLAVNLGTRGVDAARNLVEYCNHPGGSYWSDLRIKHGVREPHGVKVWCLGNEMAAPWQIEHKTADEYGRIALEAAKAMRRVDPGIELVACGSSNRWMPTFGDWEATVREETYDYVDYLTLHNYYEDATGDPDSFLASSHSMDDFIHTVSSTCDHIKGLLHSKKTMQLSFDEWNVWHQTEFHRGDDTREPWRDAPPMAEDVYTAAEGVVVGSLLISLLNHADRVRMACLAQLVNTIAPITTEPGGRCWRQPTFFPFADVTARARGQALRVELSGPTHDTLRYGEVPSVAAAATYHGERGDLVAFLVNRSREVPCGLDLELAGGLEGFGVVEHRVLHSADPEAQNTADRPDTVLPRTVPVETPLRLEPVSWNVLRLRRQ